MRDTLKVLSAVTAAICIVGVFLVLACMAVFTYGVVGFLAFPVAVFGCLATLLVCQAYVDSLEH